ncbi:MAG TPA: 50S ribosomal protein L21 [Verrucomicrobiae bacterium]|nr:50S ribosomal protein L21 [Verrucomicrobiae bacterium]
MYAVIETGGKQYRVEVGTELEVELLDGEPGDSIKLDRILLVADGDESSIGRPVVADAAVEAEIVRRDRGEKLISFKYRPKARRRVKKGHRQELTILRITDVKLGSKSAAADKRKADAAAKTERQRLEEAAAKQAAEDAALAAKLAKAAAPKPAAKASAKAGAKESKPAARSTAKTAPKAAADTKKTPRAKTQSGAADAKPASKPAAKPTAKPRATKKDE